MTEQTQDIHDILRAKPLSELTDGERQSARELALSILRADYYGDARLTERERRSARDLALSILRADYYGDVRDTAESIVGAIANKEIGDRDELIERIDEVCDGAARVIYTGQAIETLLYSDNNSAYADNFGDEGMVRDGAIQWSALAFCAFRQDVIEQLDAEGVDVNDFDPEEDEEDIIAEIEDQIDAFNAGNDQA